MATIVTSLSCDLQNAVKVRYLDGNLFSQDNQANRFDIAVFDGGEAAAITGSVSADVIRADGGTVAVTGGTISGNVASITFPAAVYAIPGVVSIVVKITASSVVTTIAAVVANVYRSSTDTAVDPGTIIPSIQTLISAIETAVASIPADYSSLWTSLAPAFSSSTSYVAGQYVTYNGAVYRFNTAHSGSWAAGDVTAVNLGGELSSLKSAISSAQGYRNFFADPELEYLKNGRNVSADILEDIFVSLDMSNNVFVYDGGNVKKAGTTSGSKLYGCTVLYDKTLMGDSVCFSLDLKTSDITAYLYIRFLNSSDTQISQTNVTASSSGFKYISASIPSGTKKIKVWVSSSATGEWSVSNLALTNGVLPISGGSLYWNYVMSEPADVVDGLQNYFVDPEFTIFANSPVYGNPAKLFNWYIYESLIATDNQKLTYSNGMIVKESGTGTTNILYGCKVLNDESLFKGHVSFTVDLVDYNDNSYDFMVYIRFLNASGEKISDVSKGTKTEGKITIDNDIPANTKTLFAWFSSQSDSAWSVKNPILSSRNTELMEFGSNLWDITILGYKEDAPSKIVFVSSETELLEALGTAKKIILLNDITITADISITSDIEIDGMGHKMTANGITSQMMAISNANVTLKNIEIIGEQTKDYIIVPTTGAVLYIENCIIHTSYNECVRCRSTSKVVIRNSDIGFSYNNDGVSPQAESEVYVYNSVMHDCFDEGLSSHNSSYVECHNCEFYNNGYVVGTKTKGADSSFGGCHLGGGMMGIVESCYSHDNCTYGIGLIHFQGDLHSDIEKCFNNVVQNNGSHGIMCTYCENLTLVNNSCIANVGDAIHFGKDPTQPDDPIGIISSGYVAGNIMYENGTDSVVIDPDAESNTLHVQRD